MEKILLKIVECVTDGNKELMEEMEGCISNTMNYYKSHQEEFESRGIEEDEVEEGEMEEDEIQWIALVDILIKGGYVTECDWKVEKEDFLYNINNLNKLKSKGLKAEDKWLDEDGEITEWLEILDKKWEKEGIVMSAFDIDSDSYVLFPCETDKFEQLKDWAEEDGYRIEYGKEM
ncbi:MAG: hypothetical protein HDT39_11585 [Lachnospiraceae bacterium]|nr:hypothetical protein [Lachnospiraceae bacterium]